MAGNKMTDEEMAQEAAALVSNLAEGIVALSREKGIPLELMLSGALSTVLSMMIATVGGDKAAECCEAGASLARQHPDGMEYLLGAIPSKGRA